MATKTISLMEDAFELLKRNMLPDESFSDVVRRIFDEDNDISKFAGAWKDTPKKDIEQMKKDIKKKRKYHRF